MNKISPCLWFDSEAEAAAAFYTSVFKAGKINNTAHYLTETPGNKPIGSVLQVDFEIEGQPFTALNGGDIFKPNPSISFFVYRDSVAEVDELWEQLARGGQALMPLGEYPFNKKYGWIQDKYGVSWQLMLRDSASTEKNSIVPSLLFTNDQHGKAEEALRFYATVFDDATVGEITTYPADTEMHRAGNLMYGSMKVSEQTLTAMDGGTVHAFGFSEGISLQVFCKDQAEIDKLTEKLSAVPEAEVCGWVKDKFGVSWQIAPIELGELMDESNPERAKRVMEALLKMGKLDIETLRSA